MLNQRNTSPGADCSAADAGGGAGFFPAGDGLLDGQAKDEATV